MPCRLDIQTFRFLILYYHKILFKYLDNMPLLDKIPNVNKCCGCVTDLKTAAAIIAVLGIVSFL